MDDSVDDLGEHVAPLASAAACANGSMPEILELILQIHLGCAGGMELAEVHQPYFLNQAGLLRSEIRSAS